MLFVYQNINKELINRLILLENDIKILKDENQKLKNEINNLKENIIIEKVSTLYPKDLKFNNINIENNEYILSNENSWQYDPFIKYKGVNIV